MNEARRPSRRRATHPLAALAFVACAAVPAVVRAGESDGADKTKATSDGASKEATEEARAHFQKGIEDYADGDFQAALVELQRAYALKPTYRLLYNLGQVAYELRDYIATERYFTQYLAEGKDEIPENRRAEVEQDLARVRARIASVRLTTNQRDARLFVDDREVGRAPLAEPYRLSAGQHRFAAQHAGFSSVSRVVDLAGGDDVTVRLDFGARLAPAASVTAEQSSVNWPLWTGVATGVFAAGAGVFGYMANRDSRDYAGALDRRTSRSELDQIANRAEDKAIVSDVLLGAAVVSGVVTVVLLLTDGPAKGTPRHDAARLAISPRTVGIAF